MKIVVRESAFAGGLTITFSANSVMGDHCSRTVAAAPAAVAVDFAVGKWKTTCKVSALLSFLPVGSPPATCHGRFFGNSRSGAGS